MENAQQQETTPQITARSHNGPVLRSHGHVRSLNRCSSTQCRASKPVSQLLSRSFASLLAGDFPTRNADQDEEMAALADAELVYQRPAIFVGVLDLHCRLLTLLSLFDQNRFVLLMTRQLRLQWGTAATTRFKQGKLHVQQLVMLTCKC